MLIEAILREVGVSIYDIDDHRTPSNDVAVLGVLLETNKAANDIRTESGRVSNG
jgi:hypothetical protein